MNAKEIITLVSSQSIGLDDPSDSDIAIFLRYLNLTYFELLRLTILKNPVYPKVRETLECTDGVLDPTAKSIFSIRGVYLPESNKPLTGTNFDAVFEIDPGLKETSTTPELYYYDSGNVNIYPLYTGSIGIIYAANPELLNINSLSNNIYIPEIYHSVLVDGTSYYLFQSETGFRNQMKIQESLKRWSDGKADLNGYLSRLVGQKHYSTYSAV
jgi:hypothetical protein